MKALWLGFASVVCGFFAMSSVIVHADDFSGSWRGDGFVLNGSDSVPARTPINLTIKQTETSLEMKECWQEVQDDGQRYSPCISSSYPLQDDGEIYNNGQKIGDVYPYNIITFQSNDQVSEQISIQKIKDGVIHYRYTYSNLDGASTVRDAVMTLLPK